MPWGTAGSVTSSSRTARPATGVRTTVLLTHQTIRVWVQHGLNFAGSRLSYRLRFDGSTFAAERVTDDERRGETSSDPAKVGFADSGVWAIAAARQEPDAADC